MHYILITFLVSECPLISFTMPTKNVYCTFDTMCMGVECCINAKVFIFLKVFKAYARFDPCEFKFVLGLDTWNYTYEFPKISFDGKVIFCFICLLLNVSIQ